VDYARGTARTTYGATGVKVWVFHGEIFGKPGDQQTKE
jgi:ribosomal protein S3